MAAPSYN